MAVVTVTYHEHEWTPLQTPVFRNSIMGCKCNRFKIWRRPHRGEPYMDELTPTEYSEFKNAVELQEKLADRARAAKSGIWVP